MSDESLEEFIARFKAMLGNPHESVRDGDKGVTYRSASDLREQIALAIELEQGPPDTYIVARPRRVKR